MQINSSIKDYGPLADVYPVPTYCLSDFSEQLLGEMASLRNLLFENELNEGSMQVRSVVWYFKKTNSYHVDIKSSVHVSSQSVYFYGILSPHNEAHFKSFSMPLAKILEGKKIGN